MSIATPKLPFGDPRARVLVLGTQGVVDALQEMGVPCCLPGSPEADTADAIYVAWHPECTMDHIHAACGRVLDGAAFLTASDVPYFATKDGRSFGYSCAINGAVARVTGCEPEPCGKPSAPRTSSARRSSAALEAVAPRRSIESLHPRRVTNDCHNAGAWRARPRRRRRASRHRAPPTAR